MTKECLRHVVVRNLQDLRSANDTIVGMKATHEAMVEAISGLRSPKVNPSAFEVERSWDLVFFSDHCAAPGSEASASLDQE